MSTSCELDRKMLLFTYIGPFLMEQAATMSSMLVFSSDRKFLCGLARTREPSIRQCAQNQNHVLCQLYFSNCPEQRNLHYVRIPISLALPWYTPPVSYLASLLDGGTANKNSNSCSTTRHRKRKFGISFARGHHLWSLTLVQPP